MELGQKVKIVKIREGASKLVGKEGIIRDTQFKDDNVYGVDMGIEFKSDKGQEGNNLNGSINTKTGWYFVGDDLE